MYTSFEILLQAAPYDASKFIIKKVKMHVTHEKRSIIQTSQKTQKQQESNNDTIMNRSKEEGTKNCGFYKQSNAGFVSLYYSSLFVDILTRS